MFGKSKIWMIVALATMLSLAGAATAMAQTPTGTSAGGATAPFNGYVQISSAQQQWYTFNSSQVTAAATDAGITIELSAVPQGSVDFAVWTQEALNAFNAGDTTLGKAVGRGTLQTKKQSDGTTTNLYNGNLLWVGRSLGPTTYYVQVFTNAATPVSYRLNISGNYISFPAGSPANQALQMTSARNNAAQQAPLFLPSTGPASTASTASTATSARAGSGTENALSLNGQQRTLGVGQQEWYTFQYPGHDSDGYQPQANVVLRANPQGSATFSVWTADALRALANGDRDFGVAIGHGTLHPTTDGGNTVDRFGGDLEWAGKSAAAGTYYVQVQQTGSVPGTYSLQFSMK